MAKKTTGNKPPKTYQLIKAIRGTKQGNIEGEGKLYKANVVRRDKNVRKLIESEVPKTGSGKISPGQLIMFNYFYPKTEKQLQYYDAMPCTIFFGIVKAKEGKRVLGFNLQYYPPRIRFQIIDRIFEIFKPLYLESWDSPLQNEMSDFNYKMLMRQLQNAKLDFGVRMYIPSLIHKVAPIPPMYWQKAVFTEGHFKKETREQILNYWKEKILKETK
jgi:ribosomal protein S26